MYFPDVTGIDKNHCNSNKIYFVLQISFVENFALIILHSFSLSLRCIFDPVFPVPVPVWYSFVLPGTESGAVYQSGGHDYMEGLTNVQR